MEESRAYKAYKAKLEEVLSQNAGSWQGVLSVHEFGKLIQKEVEVLQVYLRAKYQAIDLQAIITPQVTRNKYSELVITGYQVELRPETPVEAYRRTHSDRTWQVLQGELELRTREAGSIIDRLLIAEKEYPGLSTDDLQKVERAMLTSWSYVSISWVQDWGSPDPFTQESKQEWFIRVRIMN